MLPIGQLIKEELASQERTVSWFARKLHLDRSTSTGCSRKILSTPICWAESPLFLAVIFLKSCLQTFANGGITPAGDTVGRAGALRSVCGSDSFSRLSCRGFHHNNVSVVTRWRCTIRRDGEAIMQRAAQHCVNDYK